MTRELRQALAELRVAAAGSHPLKQALAKRLRREWPELATAIEHVLQAAPKGKLDP